MSIQSALRCSLVPTVFTNIGLRLLVNRVIVSNEGGLLAGLVVAEGARERLVVQVDHVVVDLQGFVRLKLLATGFANVNLEILKM